MENLIWLFQLSIPFEKAQYLSSLWVSVIYTETLRWRHNGCHSVSNNQPHDCLANRLFRRRSKKTSKLHATGLCAGKSPGTGEFPSQMASNAENASIWWRHHDLSVVTVPTLSSLLLPKDVLTTAIDATKNNKGVIMTTCSYQCFLNRCCLLDPFKGGYYT